jgi:amino acid transporter
LIFEVNVLNVFSNSFKSSKGIILRHVLEHIPNPFDFLCQLRRANGGGGLIYIEVPCFDWICKKKTWYDIFYEHVNYFRMQDFIKMFSRVILKKYLFGPPIRLSQRRKETIGKFKALSILNSDALSSVAYASEEILLVLAGFGSIAFFLNFWITICIVILMMIVVFSYTQTIQAYPGGGGAYTVAMDNLGRKSGLLAAASLLVDYILTVSVSIACGIFAIVSMVPELKNLSVTLACASLVVLVLLNLRGIRENGLVVLVPTYIFIVLILWMVICSGFVPSVENVGTVKISDPLSQQITIFIILRAFSAGCIALTGIEAVSNSVPVFKEPKTKNAIITLWMMGITLAVLFIFVAYLCNKYQILPKDSESLLSQITRVVFGNGLQYQLMQIFTALILILAANSAFVDFPRLCSLLARDGYLPKQLMHTGDRLAFSNGIILLGILSGIVMIIFNADTYAIIPLYAIGVFISFTLSQAGMVVHWVGKSRIKMAINGLGALCCFITTLVIAVVKFFDGAWLIVFAIPVFIYLFYAIKSHYTRIEKELSLQDHDLESNKKHFKILIPIKDLNKATVKAINFAKSISHNSGSCRNLFSKTRSPPKNAGCYLTYNSPHYNWFHAIPRTDNRMPG